MYAGISNSSAGRNAESTRTKNDMNHFRDMVFYSYTATGALMAGQGS